MKIKVQQKNVLRIKGILIGLLSALIGSIIFSIVINWGFPLTIRRIYFYSLFCFIASFIPGILGGIFIIQILHKQESSQNLSIKFSIIIGFTSGLLTGFLPTSVVSYLLFLTGKAYIMVLISLSFKAIIISTLLGICISLSYYFHINKKRLRNKFFEKCIQ